MKYFWYCDPDGNFGDDLNTWLWPRLFGRRLDEVSDEWLFVGIGSILNYRIPFSPRTVVFGSGVGYGALPMVNSSWLFAAVRGSISREALNLPASVPLGDPGILVPEFAPRPALAAHVALMPHHASLALLPWRMIARIVGWKFVNATSPVEQIIAELAGARLVVTSAMHGAIVADAFRVPWIPFLDGAHLDTRKWLDWGGALGVVPQFHRLLTESIRKRGRYRPGKLVDAVRVAASLQRLVATAHPQLSDDSRLRDAQAGLLETASLLPMRLQAQ